jgi:hypothetical protein
MEHRTSTSNHAAERLGSYLLDYDTIIELSVELGADAVNVIETSNS